MSGFSIQNPVKISRKVRDPVQVLRHCNDVPPGRVQHQDQLRAQLPVRAQHQDQGGATLDDDYKLVFRRVYILAISTHV